jgi:hypothetical protein
LESPIIYTSMKIKEHIEYSFDLVEKPESYDSGLNKDYRLAYGNMVKNDSRLELSLGPNFNRLSITIVQWNKIKYAVDSLIKEATGSSNS